MADPKELVRTFMTGQASMLTESKNNVIGTNPTGGVIEAAKKRAKQ